MPRFSQRYGYKSLPPQLTLGVISDSFRSRIKLALDRLVNKSFRSKNYYNKIGPQGKAYFQDLWVKELSSTETINYNLENLDILLNGITETDEFHEVFDLIEFTFDFTKNQNFINEVTQAFSDERLAYRIRKAEVVAVGTEEQAVTINKAHDHLEKIQANSAKSHLHQASRLLAQGDFGGSVRESISAVESVARRIEPNAGSLGTALNLINKNPDFNIHSSLNEAFKKIYGYTSDTEGIRHCLIDESVAPVSEAEALFMLGACSAFIPYLSSAVDEN